MQMNGEVDVVIEEESRGRILLVDDSPEARALMRKALEKKGYTVDDKENGSAALSAFLNAEYDLIVVDFMMPEKNGLEVLQEIRKRRTPEELPVIMITAKQKPELLKAAIRHGINDFFIKPVKTSEFVERIERHLIRLEFFEIKNILASLNMHDSSLLNPEVQLSLQEQNLVAYPFELNSVKFYAIIEKLKNPHTLAKEDESRVRNSMTIIGKGVYLWNIVWPRGFSTRFEMPRKIFNANEDFSSLLDEGQSTKKID